MDEFEIGDKVEVINEYDNYKVGDVGIITSINKFCYRINGDRWGALANHFKKVEDLYEDQWHLNDGKVEIPDDADKLEKDGSVVAFRKRKVKPFEFGEKLRIKKSLWSISIEANPGFDYVNAVYLSKYFDGIKVYVDSGEEGWETCIIDLSKVERLT